MFSVEHASSMGPAVMEGRGTGLGFLFSSYEQAVEFPQVLASINYSSLPCDRVILHSNVHMVIYFIFLLYSIILHLFNYSTMVHESAFTMYHESQSRFHLGGGGA